MALYEAALLFGTLVAETILASVQARAHKQAGHMDASDLIKVTAKTPCKEGAVHICLQVTLKQRLRSLAPGLTPRSVLDKMAVIQMVDVHLPTTDGRTVILSRYTEPEMDQAILLQRLKISLPAQPPPRVAAGDVP